MPTVSVVTLFVPDLGAAEEFYCDLLGFKVEARYGPEIVTLAHAGCAIVLNRCERATRPAYPRDAQVTIGLATADVDAELERLRRAGVEAIFNVPQEFPMGRFIAVRDPAGNVVELLQFNA